MRNSMRNLAHRCCSLLPLLLWPAAAIGADWPQFLGPNYRSEAHPEIDLPREWSESTNVAWRTDIPGLGWSTPVIVGDAIYLTTAVERPDSGFDLQLVNIDAGGGKIRWRKTVFAEPADAPDIHKKNSHASPTPVVEGDRIYTHFGHQGTACLDRHTGEMIWSNREHTFNPVHGNGGSPLLVDGLLVFTCDGSESPYTVALDAASGRDVWRVDRGVTADRPFSFCTPIALEVDGQTQIVSTGSNIVQAIDTAGNVVWSVRFEGFSVTPRPLYVEGLVILSTGFMTPQMLAIDPSGQGDVTDTHVRWRSDAKAPNTPSPVVIGGVLLIVSDSGIASGLDVQTGETLWRQRLGGNYSATPLVRGDMAYLLSEEGVCQIARVSRDGIEVLGKNQLPGRTFASPTPLGNRLLIRNEQTLFAIGR